MTGVRGRRRDGAEFDPHQGTVLASNQELHPQILELLNAAKA